jgi:threonylcarbamoyladenosine tRNA methylthiotransferase MtaB
MILKRMKRRHLREDIIKVCQNAKKLRPNITFGADIIAGFPTETEEMFQNTLDLISECDLTFLHVFPYSERPDTPAAKMPQVDKTIRKERASILRQAGQKQLQGFLLKQVGKNLSVIVENENFGRTENFARVKLDQELSVGSLVNVEIIGHEKDYLLARL